MRKIFCALLLLSTSWVWAESFHLGCKIQPHDLPAVGTRIVQAAVQKKRSVHESMIVQADIQGEAGDQDSKIEANWEGFYRPQEDGFYSLLPIPLLGFELSRARNVIYVCAHIDPDVRKQHMTIYLLRGYHLDPSEFATIIGNILNRPKLEVTGLAPILIPFGSLSQASRKFPDIVRLPFRIFDWQFEAYGGIQRIISNMIGDISGLAIERIVLTEDTLELASGVDLDHPNKARWIKKINLKDTDNN